MVNIEESQNTTVITGNTKLMMRIAGVLFAVLAVIHIALTCTPEIISNILMMGSKLFYYLNIVVEIFFSIACIIQKKAFFLISLLIVIGLYSTRMAYCIINRYYVDLSNICVIVSFVIIFLLFIAQQKNNRKLITVGKCVFVIPLIAYMVFQYACFVYIFYFFYDLLKSGHFNFGLLLEYLQHILLITAIFILSLSLIITPKKFNVPASSAAYSKSYQSLVPHVLLLLFTRGIYYLVWIYRTTDSLNACKNEEYRTPINKLLLCMFVPFYSIYWTYKSAHRIDMLGYEKGILGETATLSLILSLFVPILPPILMQSKLNSVIMADSASPAVATAMQYAAKPVDNGYNDLQYAAKPADNGYNDLEKLKELYDKGVITEEEFTDKKKQVLGI